MALFQGLLFIGSVGGAAFFAMVETALTSVSLSGWQRLVRDQPRISSAYRLWSENPSQVLATLLFGNTFFSLGASVWASAALRGWTADRPVSPWRLVLATSFFAGKLILVAGEILPKLYARRRHEQVLRHAAGALVFLTRGLRPLLGGAALLADVLRRAFSHRPPEPLMTAEELSQILSDSRSQDLAPSARRILSNLVSFSQVKVRDVMIPRAQVAAVRLEQNTERVFERIVRSGFSRIPVYFGSIDNI